MSGVQHGLSQAVHGAVDPRQTRPQQGKMDRLISLINMITMLVWSGGIFNKSDDRLDIRVDQSSKIRNQRSILSFYRTWSRSRRSCWARRSASIGPSSRWAFRFDLFLSWSNDRSTMKQIWDSLIQKHQSREFKMLVVIIFRIGTMLSLRCLELFPGYSEREAWMLRIGSEFQSSFYSLDLFRFP